MQIARTRYLVVRSLIPDATVQGLVLMAAVWRAKSVKTRTAASPWRHRIKHSSGQRAMLAGGLATFVVFR
jgi:hypothetical protein